MKTLFPLSRRHRLQPAWAGISLTASPGFDPDAPRPRDARQNEVETTGLAAVLRRRDVEPGRLLQYPESP